MKIKTCVIFLSLILVLGIASMGFTINYKNHDIKPLVEVAKSVEGDILGYSIHGHVKVEEISMERIEVVLLAMDYSGKIHDKSMDRDGDYHYIFVDWFEGNTYYKLIVSDTEDGSYLSLSADMDENENVFELYDKIQSVLNDIDDSFHITTSIFKELEGDMVDKEVIEQVSYGFSLLAAQLVTDYQDGKSFAFLGYSPFLVNSVEVDGKLHNIHMAVHFDDFSKSYHLVIANPIIETSY